MIEGGGVVKDADEVGEGGGGAGGVGEERGCCIYTHMLFYSLATNFVTPATSSKFSSVLP